MASPFTGAPAAATPAGLVMVGRLSLVLQHLAIPGALVRAPAGRRGVALCGAAPIYDQQQLDYMAGRPVPLADASRCDLCRAAADQL